jgi:hypothetical protein
MRTAKIVLVVAALGTATLMWGISGFGSLYGTDNPVDGLQSGERLEKQANQSAVSENGSFDSSAEGADEGDIVGIIISGTSALVSFASMAALLPFELQQLGFPRYFAYPIGLLAQAIVGIGVVQFAANRVFR